MAAFVVVTSLLELVEQQLLQPNPCYILDGREMIVQLLEKLQFLQAFLEESGTKTNDLEAKEMLEAQIKDVATEAEGKLGLNLRRVYLAANGGEHVVEASQELFRTLQQVLKGIERLEEKILMQKAKDTASHLGSSTSGFKEDNTIVAGNSQNALEPKDDIIVGFDKEIRALTEKLVDRYSLELKLIPLVGKGGQGKTTLAKIVYQHRKIMDSFQIRAWTVLSQECNVKEMLINLLSCIFPITNQISNQDEAELADQLCNTLMGQRYLIVLDDVWTYEAWDAIQRYFPDNSKGSRIIITTRDLGVAEYLWITNAWSIIQKKFPKKLYKIVQLTKHPYLIGRVIRRPPNRSKDDCPKLIIPKGFEPEVGDLFRSNLFIMKFLSDEESWALFANKVFKHRFSCPRDFEIKGKSIVRQCRGLPMAVALAAGLLATARESSEIWSDVEKNVRRAGDEILGALTLCYNYLPNHLKACFLYFGVFREDSSILVKKLVRLWVAEGFLKPEKNKTLEEVAKSYLYDLINRNLVQIDKRGVDGKIKSCKIHDRVLEVCVREAKKENITCIIGLTHAPEASRWISCQSSHWPITQASYGNHTSNEICSILHFGKDLYLSKCRLVYHCLKLLRVLDLSLLKYLHGMPSGISDLIHLRFLALSTIGSLSKFRFFKLQHLQTLIIFSWMGGCHLQLPCDILNLPQLRHLHLEKRSSQYIPSLVRNNLQSLFWLKVASSDQKPNFGMVPNLKELGIYVEGEVVPTFLDSLVHLHLLEKLKIEIGRVEHFYLPIGFPPNLKMLTLRYTYLPWKKMDIISKLPNLEVLKLKDFAFCGPEWKPKGRFRRLNVLLIKCSNLKRWNAVGYHFPVLERLVLRYCWDLKKIPIAFANIDTLNSIVLDTCYSSLVDSAYDIYWMVAPRAFSIHDLGTKAELPSNDYSEEETVEFPSNDCSEEEDVEFPSNDSSEEEIVELPKKKVLKALKKKVLTALKKKLLNCQRRKC